MNLPSDRDSSGRTLAAEEIKAVSEAISSGTLTSTAGTFTKSLEAELRSKYNVRHAHACSSGTAAVHIAVAAIDPSPGDEIITTAITDMGALTPILYQSAIPVFADVDPKTCNVTPESIESRITDRTRAIIVTHLFGHPCDMTGIMNLARKHGIPVIEDCAQAYLSKHEGKLIGTFGDIACFSLQQGKHITTGEGGFVLCDDEGLATRIFLLINKAWGYGMPNPDHYFLALNYRMSELQGAVALAQLAKLDEIVDNRVNAARKMTDQLDGIAGIDLPVVRQQDLHSYWKYCLNIDEQVIPGGVVALAKRLATRGIASAPRYIQKPSFECVVFRDQKTFGSSRYPFTLAAPSALDYSRSRFPGTYKALNDILVMPWNERYEDTHVEYIAASVRECIVEVES